MQRVEHENVYSLRSALNLRRMVTLHALFMLAHFGLDAR